MLGPVDSFCTAGQRDSTSHSELAGEHQGAGTRQLRWACVWLWGLVLSEPLLHQPSLATPTAYALEDFKRELLPLLRSHLSIFHTKSIRLPRMYYALSKSEKPTVQIPASSVIFYFMLLKETSHIFIQLFNKHSFEYIYI